jgi:hypothetical protein
MSTSATSRKFVGVCCELRGAIRLGIVGRPIDEAFIYEAPSRFFGVNFHQHVGVRVVAGGSHNVVLRTVGMVVVDPLVLMA